MVPFAELPLPREHHGRIAPLTLRFRFEGPFSLVDDQVDAIASILGQLEHHLGDSTALQQPSVSFPSQHGSVKHVDVTFATVEQFVRGQHAKLSFKGYRLSIDFSGLAISREHMVIVVQEVPDVVGLRNIAAAVAERLAPYGRLSEAWALYSVESSSAPKFTGELVCLFRRHTVSQALPGFVRVGGNHHRLSYNGRDDHLYRRTQRCRRAC